MRTARRAMIVVLAALISLYVWKVTPVGPFGVLGWRVFQDDCILRGTIGYIGIYHNEWGAPHERDWNVYLYTKTPPEGPTGSTCAFPGGEIELEVEPKPGLDNIETLRRYVAPFRGRLVEARGTYVNDLSHNPKWELHPLVSLRQDNGILTRILAVSENSGDRALWPFTAYVPYTKESRSVSFEISRPTITSEPRFMEEQNSAAYVNIYYLPNNPLILRIDIQTGRPDDGFGWYYLYMTWRDPEGPIDPPPGNPIKCVCEPPPAPCPPPCTPECPQFCNLLPLGPRGNAR